MSVAPVAQNKTQFHSCYVPISFYFVGISRKFFPPIVHQGFALEPLGNSKFPQFPSCIQERYAVFQAFI